MSKLMLRLPTGFSAAFKQVFVAGSGLPAPDLRDLSDRGLVDIGLIRRKSDFEAAKPFWQA